MKTYTMPFSPVLPMNGLRSEIDRIFDDAFSTVRPAGTWTPAVDAREEAEAFVFDFEMPGVAPENFEVLAEEGSLVVKGERTFRQQSEGERRLMGERISGRFERRFRLPKSADLSSVSATYEHGVLSVRVAKVAPAQPRRIQVNVGGSNQQVISNGEVSNGGESKNN